MNMSKWIVYYLFSFTPQKMEQFIPTIDAHYIIYSFYCLGIRACIEQNNQELKCPWGNNYDMTICVMPHRKLQGHCNYSLFAAWEVK